MGLGTWFCTFIMYIWTTLSLCYDFFFFFLVGGGGGGGGRFGINSPPHYSHNIIEVVSSLAK